MGGRPQLDTQQFIDKARIVWGDKYNYEKVLYTKSREKVIITCPIHGDFGVTPNNHLRGNGCPKCSKNALVDKEEFIRRSIDTHGDVYDYSMVKYSNMNTPVTIVCKEHGAFIQRPAAHIRGGVCPKCSRQNITTERYLSELQGVFPEGAYTYEDTVYVDCRTHITVTCAIHGSFKISPDKHRSGQRCPKCTGRNKTVAEAILIMKSKIKNYESLDFSSITTTKSADKVTIKCLHHGYFQTIIQNLLVGKGCPECGRATAHINRRLPIDTFVARSLLTHTQKYDYSNVRYTRIDDIVQIGCPVHGMFLQRAQHHMRGSDCPRCSSSKGNEYVRQYLERNNIPFEAEFRHHTCRYNGVLAFDFAIFTDYTKSELRGIIEFDGYQHFYAVDFYGGEKALTSLQIRDAIKNQYCEDNCIPMLRIPYTKLNSVDVELNKWMEEFKNGRKK